MRAVGGKNVEEAAHPAPAVEKHEERQERHSNDRERRARDGTRRARSRPLEPEEGGDPAALVDVHELLSEMEAALEKRERPALGVELTKMTRKRLDEVCRRGNERWNDEKTDGPERCERHEEDDRRRPAASEPATAQSLDRGVQRHREQRGDEDPGDRAACEVDERQDKERPDGDRDPYEDGPRCKGDRHGRAALGDGVLALGEDPAFV